MGSTHLLTENTRHTYFIDEGCGRGFVVDELKVKDWGNSRADMKGTNAYMENTDTCFV